MRTASRQNFETVLPAKCFLNPHSFHTRGLVGGQKGWNLRFPGVGRGPGRQERPGTRRRCDWWYRLPPDPWGGLTVVWDVPDAPFQSNLDGAPPRTPRSGQAALDIRISRDSAVAAFCRSLRQPPRVTDATHRASNQETNAFGLSGVQGDFVIGSPGPFESGEQVVSWSPGRGGPGNVSTNKRSRLPGLG